MAAKLVLFAAMLSLAANNRWRLTPALKRTSVSGDSEGSWTRLRISVALEGAAGATVLALVAWLGTLAPAN
jgi:copper resistance protein D